MSPNQEKEGEIEMCEVYDKIENRGIEKGKVLIVVKLVRDGKYTIEGASKEFDIAEDIIRKELEKQAG